ncbi:MAG: rhomboid family intramembrane serine protease [Porphyromonadaceae bacterium]|nr:rhomboid family intramembrane serine protease [Porphyromonadaceae bacterium]
MNEKSDEKKKIYYAIFFPAIICFLVILAFLFERGMGLDFKIGGVFPREIKALPNIFTMPFIHSDLGHLANNIFSFFVLSVCLYYFYGEFASKVLIFSAILSGIILWIIGRDAWHIGLSGIVYALSFFLFFSGILRKHMPLIAISLVVVFLYGNNVWHLFPWQKFDPISWEGHLAGAVSGILFAFIYRKQGPQKPVKIWEDEEDDNDEEDAIWMIENNLDNNNEKNIK